jgi:hypothetical protein
MYLLHAINSDRQTQLLNVLGKIAMYLGGVDTISGYLTFQGLLFLVACDKHLPHERLAVARYVPDASVVRWHRTPTQHLKAQPLC